MDLLAHACYGATLCSRSGLAGGWRGAGRRWFADASVWMAVFFGLLPDMLSMWVPFALFVAGGSHGNFFGYYDGVWLEVYRFTHSLLPAFLVTMTLFMVCRRISVASLAWTVHVLCDSVSHDAGKFRTMMFYPLSEWHITGIAFWRHVWFIAFYWSILVGLWIVLIVVRSRMRSSPSA